MISKRSMQLYTVVAIMNYLFVVAVVGCCNKLFVCCCCCNDRLFICWNDGLLVKFVKWVQADRHLDRKPSNHYPITLREVREVRENGLSIVCQINSDVFSWAVILSKNIVHLWMNILNYLVLFNKTSDVILFSMNKNFF